MGKCLSCCEDPQRPTYNGQAANTTAAKSLTYPNSGGQQPLFGVKSTSDQSHVYSSDQGSKPSLSSLDRKMFSQYSKLPPIRKPSIQSESHKRTSFTSSSGSYSEAKVNTLFDKYKDPDEEDLILADGIERFCSDLDVKPEEFRVLLLAWKFEAETMCKFTRSEFTIGCKKLHVDSIRGIQSKFPDMLMEVENKDSFRDLYKWTYKFGLDSEVGQKTLPTDMAIGLWKLVYSQNTPSILNSWLEFLDKHPSIRGLPRDTWDMFANFIDVVGSDLSSYDDTEAWPSLLDDFVENENDRQNQNVVDKDYRELSE